MNTIRRLMKNHTDEPAAVPKEGEKKSQEFLKPNNRLEVPTTVTRRRRASLRKPSKTIEFDDN